MCGFLVQKFEDNTVSISHKLSHDYHNLSFLVLDAPSRQQELIYIFSTFNPHPSPEALHGLRDICDKLVSSWFLIWGHFYLHRLTLIPNGKVITCQVKCEMKLLHLLQLLHAEQATSHYLKQCWNADPVHWYICVCVSGTRGRWV